MTEPCPSRSPRDLLQIPSTLLAQLPELHFGPLLRVQAGQHLHVEEEGEGRSSVGQERVRGGGIGRGSEVGDDVLDEDEGGGRSSSFREVTEDLERVDGGPVVAVSRCKR